MSCVLEFDGASKGNPGKSGAGVILRAEDGSVVDTEWFLCCNMFFFSIFMVNHSHLKNFGILLSCE